MKSVYLQLSLREHLTCRGASKVSSLDNLEAKKEALKHTHIPEWQSGPTDICNINLDSRQCQDPLFPLLYSRVGLIPLTENPQSPHSNLPPNISQGLEMAAPKPNQITASNIGHNGDLEFVVACKGRPFTILTSPQLPTPPINYVDYGLINDLGLRMTDLQCRKLFFSGEKLRILGKVSTSVQ